VSTLVFIYSELSHPEKHIKKLLSFGGLNNCCNLIYFAFREHIKKLHVFVYKGLECDNFLGPKAIRSKIYCLPSLHAKVFSVGYKAAENLDGKNSKG
jgi:hypothetical protein